MGVKVLGHQRTKLSHPGQEKLVPVLIAQPNKLGRKLTTSPSHACVILLGIKQFVYLTQHHKLSPYCDMAHIALIFILLLVSPILLKYNMVFV